MQKKIIISIIFSIVCFNLFIYSAMAQSTNPCSSCPKGITFECKADWNTVKKGICQSNQEWYYYELPESTSGASIIVTPEQGTDVDLYAVWDKSCPSTSKYICVSNSGGPGKPEECHYVFTSFNSPNYFLVNRVSGSGCYNILLSRYETTTVKTTQPTTSYTTIQNTIIPKTTQPTTSYTTIQNTIIPQNETGKNNLLIIIIVVIIIVIILSFVMKLKNKY